MRDRHEVRTPDEETALRASLDRMRDAALWKLTGLSDEEARRPMLPSGTSLAGLVKHLAVVEWGWFCETFDRPSEAPAFDPDDPEADMRPRPDETVADIVALHRQARAAADAVIDELGLDAIGRSWHGATVSMRWVLVHMVEEYARHVGHAYVVRELLDGSTGDFPD